MNSITQYISEKLHLNKGNKDLVTMEDPTDFIESFNNAIAKNHIIDLIRYCVKAVNQKGYGNRLSNELRFCRTNGRYDERNVQNINILSRHHKRILDWKIGYRNKYASQRWINDTRGCGYGCIVAQKRFIY